MSEKDWKDTQEEKKAFDFEASDVKRLKLTEGEHHLRLLGMYKVFRYHWLPSVRRVVRCPDGCPICKSGDIGRYRYAINVYNYKTKEVQIVEFGRRLKIDLMNIVEVWGGADKFELKIIRTGTSLQDTRYSPVAIPSKEKLPDNIKTYNLDKIYQPTPIEKINELLGDNPTPISENKNASSAAEKKPEASVVEKEVDLESLLGDDFGE